MRRVPVDEVVPGSRVKLDAGTHHGGWFGVFGEWLSSVLMINGEPEPVYLEKGDAEGGSLA